MKEIVQHVKTKEKAQNFENIVSIQNMSKQMPRLKAKMYYEIGSKIIGRGQSHLWCKFIVNYKQIYLFSIPAIFYVNAFYEKIKIPSFLNIFFVFSIGSYFSYSFFFKRYYNIHNAQLLINIYQSFSNLIRWKCKAAKKPGV